MEGLVTLNNKERKRLTVLNQVIMEQLSVSQASQVLGFSSRHVWRILAAYRKEDAAALAHGNRGRKPSNAIEDSLRAKVVELVLSTYKGFNDQHFTELLEEKEGIYLSRSSVRNILRQSGIRSPHKRRPPKHRSRRERYPQEGMLLQIDASHHDWLQSRGPCLSLIAAIDDAGGIVPYGLFRYEEDSVGYVILLRNIVLSYGIPQALYHDRHSIFEVSTDRVPSIDEQLSGKRPLTQFGRIMEELGITSIPALSPQARGRIERLWKTFQDRLVSELRLAGASTLEEANRVLWDFLPRFNQRFAVPAAQPGSAYRTLPSDFVPDEVFCFKYLRTAGADNVVRFRGQRLQIMPSNGRLSYARCRVEVHEDMDGKLNIYYQGHCLATKPAPAEASALREQKKNKAELVGVTTAPTNKNLNKPSIDHPWRLWVYRANNKGD